MAAIRLSGSITGTGVTSAVSIFGVANILLAFDGGAATIDLERSFDDGVTYDVASKDSTPTDATFTESINGLIEEPERDVLYRFNCTAFTSGTIRFRIST